MVLYGQGQPHLGNAAAGSKRSAALLIGVCFGNVQICPLPKSQSACLKSEPVCRMVSLFNFRRGPTWVKPWRSNVFPYVSCSPLFVCLYKLLLDFLFFGGVVILQLRFVAAECHRQVGASSASPFACPELQLLCVCFFSEGLLGAQDWLLQSHVGQNPMHFFGGDDYILR